jgi:HJR/Mrr/RecB family endonuclease
MISDNKFLPHKRIIFTIRGHLFDIKRVLNQKTSLNLKNIFKTQMVVDLVALASNFSPPLVLSTKTRCHTKKQIKASSNENPRESETRNLDVVYGVEASSFVQIHIFPSNSPLRLNMMNSSKLLVSKGSSCSIFSL